MQFVSETNSLYSNWYCSEECSYDIIAFAATDSVYDLTDSLSQKYDYFKVVLSDKADYLRVMITDTDFDSDDDKLRLVCK